MIPAHLDSRCTEDKNEPICRSPNCIESVKQGPSGWFIAYGHAGFNSPANNRGGYRSARAALAAIRRYSGTISPRRF